MVKLKVATSIGPGIYVRPGGLRVNAPSKLGIHQQVARIDLTTCSLRYSGSAVLLIAVRG